MHPIPVHRLQKPGLSGRHHRQWAIVALVAALVVIQGTTTAGAHSVPPNCLTNLGLDAGKDPDCNGHWRNSHMQYHFTGEITKSHHQGHRNRFTTAANNWINATNPNSVWHVHVASSKPSHVGVVNTSGDTLGFGRPDTVNSSNHIPKVNGVPGPLSSIGLWLRHDIWEISCGSSACSWYTGTGSPGSLQIDAIGAWMEEIGHAQGISHYDADSHTGHNHTMSGNQTSGTTSKRSLATNEKQHACNPYALAHNKSC